MGADADAVRMRGVARAVGCDRARRACGRRRGTAALDCVHIETGLRVDGVSLSSPSRLYRRLRCGSTSGFLLEGFWEADGVCDGGPHEAEITIDVEGVGSASASTTIVGCD